MKQEFFYQNHKTSIQLEDCLKGCHSFEEFEKKVSDEFLNEDTRVGDYLSDLLDQYDKSAAGVSGAALLNPSYVGLIINGKKNNPSRDALISICLAMGTTFEEVQRLLKYAGYAPLYVRRKRDVIIWFGFMKGHNVQTVNIDLYNKGLKLLTRYKEKSDRQ